MAQKEYLNNAGLEHYDEKIKEYIGDHSNIDIVALKEESPATAAHNIGDYITYNHVVYEVIDDINIDDLLIVDSNIEVATLAEGTVIYSDDDNGSTSSLSYNDLGDKPQIAGTTLQGNKSLADLGIASAEALTGKVDKVEGKGLSTNDYDNTEKSKVADNTGAIEAIENVTGAKNQFALAYNLGTTGLSTVDDELKNTLTDTVSSFVLHFRGIKNDDTQDLLFGDVISSTGNYEYTVTITSNYKSLFFKHNGTTQDLGIYIPAVATGRWILSFNVVGYNPSVVGGLEITEIMLRPAGTDPTYVPYAMTNRELTKLNPSQTSVNGLTLIRMGRVRLLHFEGPANLITGEIIAQEDRPSAMITATAIVNNISGQYHRMGALTVSANGGLNAYAAANYDAQANMDNISSSSTTWIFGDVVWFV